MTLLSLAAGAAAGAANTAVTDVSAAVSSAVLLSSSVLYAAAAPSGRSVKHTALTFSKSAAAIPGNPTPVQSDSPLRMSTAIEFDMIMIALCMCRLQCNNITLCTIKALECVFIM
jgi:hypothetical protein